VVLGVNRDRRELEHRALGPAGQQRAALHRVAVVLQNALVKPVVGDLVVVPLDVLGDLGREAADVLVHQVVLVVAAELVEGLGDLGFLLGHDVLPHAPAR
jgi:hypothetical protein